MVKTIGDRLMAAFPTPDAAANTAASMQYAIDALPMAGDTKLGVQIGFHYGPVIQRDNDVFGDTVNLAARLTEQAARTRSSPRRETAERLAPLCRNFMRRLYAIMSRARPRTSNCASSSGTRPATSRCSRPIAPRPNSRQSRCV